MAAANAASSVQAAVGLIRNNEVHGESMQHYQVGKSSSYSVPTSVSPRLPALVVQLMRMRYRYRDAGDAGMYSGSPFRDLSLTCIRISINPSIRQEQRLCTLMRTTDLASP
jgi:hypothetical protein